MESSASISKADSKAKSAGTRRSWTPQEEQVLLQGLKDLVVKGWKCDNGFKAGYQGMLEQTMLRAFPTTNLKANPHINSKITIWKKDYNSLATMLSRSGFGWNDSTNMLQVVDDIWNKYVKTDTNAKTMRYKAWPHYPAWCEIFGKDRATGEKAQIFADAVQDMLNQDETMGDNAPTHVMGSDQVVDLDMDVHSENEEELNRTKKATSSKMSKQSKKRKGPEPPNSELLALVSSFCEKTDARFAQLVSRIGFQHDAKASRERVFDALDKMDFLLPEEKISVAVKLITKPEELDLFFSLSEENKSLMVKMVLDGKLK